MACPGHPYAAVAVVGLAARLADVFQARGLPVVVVRVSVAPDGADAVPGRAEHRARGLVLPVGRDVVDELPGQPGDIRVTSTTRAPCTAPVRTSG
ncbi:hypothetical protein [Streptomyces sp. NK08204]|uniref:hypothetical protein n=1 Tax=Streptomyces sp. NK08204 TaxID=2873260 RepID=UPI0027E258F5|nr:hypothetical protein [Streptomyces sp. NK08204]